MTPWVGGKEANILSGEAFLGAVGRRVGNTTFTPAGEDGGPEVRGEQKGMGGEDRFKHAKKDNL